MQMIYGEIHCSSSSGDIILAKKRWYTILSTVSRGFII